MGVPFFIEVLHSPQSAPLQVCRKTMAALFKQGIAPLPFAASIEELKSVLGSLERKFMRPSIFIINTYWAEEVLEQLDPILGSTPCLFFVREMLTETVFHRSQLSGDPGNRISQILQKMSPRPNSVWTFGSQNSDAVAAKACREISGFLADADFTRIERQSPLQLSLLQTIKRIEEAVNQPEPPSSMGKTSEKVNRLSSVDIPVRTPGPPAPFTAPLTEFPAVVVPPQTTAPMPEPQTETASSVKPKAPVVAAAPLAPVAPAVPPAAPAPLPEPPASQLRPEAAPAQSQWLQGSLKQIGLASLLIMLDMEKKSGQLLVTRGEEALLIFIKKGRIAQACVRSQIQRCAQGAESIFYALTWTHGRFEFILQDMSAVADVINAPTTELLVEAARRMDEPAKNAS